MLVPQFSLRWVMAVVAGCGVLFLIMAAARDGSAWATALTIAIASLALTLALHGAVFFAVWVFSLFAPAGRRGLGPGQSPFVSKSPRGDSHD